MNQVFPGHRRSGIRWAALLAVSASLVLALEAIHAPAALLLGPMAAAILLATCRWTVKIPSRLSAVAQAVVGCLIAKSIPVDILGEVASDWPVFLGGVVAVVLAAALLGQLLTRLRVLPGATAIWGSMPGGATAMTLMSGAYGADIRLVALMQYLRVVCVAVAASVVASLASDGRHVTIRSMEWFPPIDPVAASGTILLIVLAMVLTRRLRINAGLLLLPLGIGLLLESTETMALELPPWLLAISYAVIGWAIGMRFTREIIRHAARALPKILGSILALIAICGGFAGLLVLFGDIDPLTAYLATSPGGADSVAIIASGTPVDLPFIMAMQVTRLLVILLVGPRLAAALTRLAGGSGREVTAGAVTRRQF